MILQVDNGTPMAIEGIAHRARVLIKGDEATVAVATADLIAMPKIGQRFQVFSRAWEFVSTLSRSRDVVSFSCRGAVDG